MIFLRTTSLRHAGTGRALLPKVRVAETLWEKFVGLMGRKELPADEALLLPDCGSIHMFFMRFSIDAVYLDRNFTVTKIVHRLRPWRLSWSLRASAVLEAPAGWAGDAGLKPGDELKLEEGVTANE